MKNSIFEFLEIQQLENASCSIVNVYQKMLNIPACLNRKGMQTITEYWFGSRSGSRTSSGERADPLR